MDRLVTVDSTDLRLNFRPSHRCAATFKITSLIHTMPVAVKLSTTRPTSYSFSPAGIALLPPLSSAVFSLVLLPSDSPPAVSPPDFLLVATAIAPALRRPTPAALSRFFSHPALPIFRDASIPIQIVSSSLMTRVMPSCSPPGMESRLIAGGGRRDEAKGCGSRWRRRFCAVWRLCGRAEGRRE